MTSVIDKVRSYFGWIEVKQETSPGILPDDVIKIVFNWLAINQRVPINQVCRHWYRMTKSDPSFVFYRNIVQKFQKELSPVRLQSICEQSTAAKTILHNGKIKNERIKISSPYRVNADFFIYQIHDYDAIYECSEWRPDMLEFYYVSLTRLELDINPSLPQRMVNALTLSVQQVNRLIELKQLSIKP